jgi:hypothetical protein
MSVPIQVTSAVPAEVPSEYVFPHWHATNILIVIVSLRPRAFTQSFQLDDIPPSLETDGDGIEQDDVLRGIFSCQQNASGVARTFERERVFSVKLSTFKGVYERKDTYQAINIMRRRVQVNLDDNLSVMDSRDPSLLWHCNNHFLDYLLLVSNKVGLHAILPRVQNDTGYNFRLQLDQPYRAFQTKHAQLGFDPKGRMLFIGFLGIENVWLALAPRQALRNDSLDVAPGTCTGPTQLSSKHYRIIVAWLAHVLDDRGIQDVYLRKEYPDISSTAALNEETNIL